MNISVAQQILQSPEYESGLAFTVREMHNRLHGDYQNVKSTCIYLAEQNKLTKCLQGNVARYHRPNKHWIHKRRLADTSHIEQE